MSFETVKSRVAAALPQFAGLDATVELVMDEGKLFIDGTVDPPTMSNQGGPADCTIRISSENLLKLMDGKLDPMLAYTFGKLKISGRTGVAMKIASAFNAG